MARVAGHAGVARVRLLRAERLEANAVAGCHEQVADDAARPRSLTRAERSTQPRHLLVEQPPAHTVVYRVLHTHVYVTVLSNVKLQKGGWRVVP